MNENMIKAIESLKEALAQSDELKAYNAAKDAYDSDETLKKQINEYNVQASILETEGRKPEEERDSALVESISARLRDLYDSISESKALADMRQAEAALSEIVSAINDAVRFTIEPEAANCTHDCSTCGGCH
ncbi:MAG: YlbF family regulator [Clostridia bacterium]|nr:YlbF family regulator [Clostridia bacterium]